MKPTQFRKNIVQTQPSKVTPKPLTIATPFYYSFHFLDEYLTALMQLDYPKELLTLVFAVQGEDDTYDVLCDFREINKHRYRKIIVEKRPEVTEAPYFQRLSALNVCDQRNWLKRQTTDDILFIGHDNFVPRDTIWRLLEAQQLGGDIAAGVYPFVQSMKMGLTSFFLLKEKGKKHQHCTAVLTYKGKLWFPECLLWYSVFGLGQLAWMPR